MAADDETEADEIHLGPDQRLVRAYAIALVVCVACLLWLALRADSPAGIRSILDIFMELALGAAAAVLAFRALVAYPYRISDLFVMVVLLSLALKFVFVAIKRLSAIGLLRSDFGAPEHFGEIAQICLLAGSILIAGGAFALRTCHRLRVERPWPRMLTVVCGMLALPCAAGSIAFVAATIMELAQGGVRNVIFFAPLWIVSALVTLHNIANLARSLTLNTESGARGQGSGVRTDTRP